jgi:pimeloyl-ACP methyl ester carboxylesterase
VFQSAWRCTTSATSLSAQTRIRPPVAAPLLSKFVNRANSESAPNAFEGADQFLFGTIGLTLVAPGNSVQDINDSVDGQQLSGERLVPQTKSIGPKDLGLEFSIPMVFIQGTEDFTTPTALARNYLDSIRAPRKAFITINGGHFAVFMHSDELLQELVKQVGPLTLTH